MRVALIRDVFHTDSSPDRLTETLAQAKEGGAVLACLPELPLNRWAPATKNAVDSDAEPPNGPRAQLQATAAREAGIALIGGSLIADATTGARHNTALLFGADGSLIGTYEKLHIPEEPGFWESSHYEPGTFPPPVFGGEDEAGLPMPFGIQICSDNNRPVGAQMLRARGADAIFVPRATTITYLDQWLTVFRANAMTTGCYVLSCNRPAPEEGVALAGPSIVVDPFGKVIVQTDDRVAFADLDSALVKEARADYPGYLALRPDMYAEAFGELA